jgi:hypothetical protein
MRIAAAIRPKKPRVFAVALALALLLVALHAIGLARGRFDPGRGLGLWLGILAAAGYLFAAAYPWRRSAARVAPARFWTQAHVYASSLAFVAALLHTGLAWPQGLVGAALLLLSGWTALTGLVGVALQKWIPTRLTEGLRVEVLLERIPELRARIVAAADARVAAAGEVLARHYRQELRPRLERPLPALSYLVEVRAGRDQAIAPLRRLAGFVSPADKLLIDDLTGLQIEKLELDAHLTLQRLLRGWLVLHAPAAGVLLGLVAFHVFTALWY